MRPEHVQAYLEHQVATKEGIYEVEVLHVDTIINEDGYLMVSWEEHTIDDDGKLQTVSKYERINILKLMGFLFTLTLKQQQ